ncbi:MAG: alpha-2-macroglobulin [Bacteroidales bacterium]|nr:alpha-2-macroglobulin [Bacteroidales bacterium]
MKSIARLLSIAMAAFVIWSCSGNKGVNEPDPAQFAPYVKSFSGSMIPEGKPVTVSLQSDIIVKENEQLFDFSPALKGFQVINENRAEFYPEAGALLPGTTYTCNFDLGKALGLEDKALQKLTFTFYSPKRFVTIDIKNLTSHDNGLTDIEGVLSINGEGDYGLKVSADGISGSISKTGDYEYDFIIAGLKREKEDRTVKVVVESSVKDVIIADPAEVIIPGTAAFKVIDATLIQEDTPYILVTFSDPVATIPMGLVSVEYGGRITYSSKGNLLKVYFDNYYLDDIVLKLDGNIKSAKGKSLGADQDIQITGNVNHPAVKIAASGNIVPDAKNVILPFSSVNLMAVDIKVIRIYESNILRFLQDNSYDGDNNVRRNGRLVLSKTLRLDTDPNLDLHKWQNFSADLSGLFKKEPGALYMVRLSFKKEYSLYGKTGPVESAINTIQDNEEVSPTWDNPDVYYWAYWGNDMDWDEYNWRDRDNPETPTYYMVDSRFPVVNLLATDIGLIAKGSETGKIWIAAASLTTSAPVSDADVTIYNYQLQKIGSGKTGSGGLTEIKVSGVPFIAKATKNGSTSYLKLTTKEQNSLSRFDVGGRKLEKGLKAYIFGERGVWRPGDTLHLTMLLQDKGSNLPDKHPVTMELYSPAGQFYTKQVNTSGNDGFYRFDIPTKADDPTGIWNSYFKVGGSSFHKSVRIETIKPNRLKINTEVGGGILEPGVSKIKMSSNWLTGPAAKGLQAKVEMTLRKNDSYFDKNFKGYNFSNPAAYFTSGTFSLLDTRLDQNGMTEAVVTIPSADEAPGMLTATLVSSVTENGGDESVTSTAVPFSPFDTYVGIKAPATDKDWYETGKDLVFNVVNIDKNGKPVSGQSLEYTIYKLGWSWWWENGSSSLYAYVNSSSAKIISSGRLTSGSKPSTITMRVEYPDWGRYLILVTNNNSSHTTGTTVTIDWPDYLGRADRKDPDALNMLTFSLDKAEYSVGETASVFIPAAAGSGNALVSIENGSGVVSSKWVKLSGNGDTVHKFKVDESMAPNFFVHISLVQPHGNVANDLPIRLYGVQPVSVTKKDSVLKPVIKMADSIHPEEKFTIGISEEKGRKMTYMIAIVDDGLLDLTSFKTPDPWSYMYSKEALGVNTWDLYDNVMGAVGGKFGQMLSVGGDDQITIGTKKESRFNPVVKVLGPFTLAKGSASHNVKLPMYVGSVRVMVVAAHDGSYGKADKTVAVKAPLMAVTTLPRVLGTGDEITVPVNVFALEDGIGNADVSVSVSGPASLVGAAKKSLKFSAPGDQIADFRLKGTGEGTAKITVQASSAGHKTSETLYLPVRNSNKPYVSVSYNTVPAGKSVTLTANDKRSDGTLTVTSFPAIDYNGAFTYVNNYPYSCSEQLSSRGLILLHIMDKLPAEKAEYAKKLLNDIINQLYARQLPDGGFTYWSGSIVSNSWVSSMAGLLLSEARAKGYDISKEVTNSWLKFQKTAVRNYRGSTSKHLNDLDQAFRLYSMAVSGNADESAMNRLKESNQTSAQAKWMLSSVYSIAGKKKTAEDIIKSIEQGFADYDSKNITFGSEYRDKAIATEALALAGRTGEAFESAHQIATLFGPGYTNTQETAFAAIALDRLYSVTGGAALDAKVEASATQQLNSTSGIASYTLKKEDKELKVTNLSSGPMYISFSQTIHPEPDAKISAKSSGLKLSVVYMGADGNMINTASIRQGTEFTAVIQVTNVGVTTDYTNIALYSPIPAGWEIFNERLFQETVAAANEYDNLDIRDDAAIWYFDLDRGTSKTFKLRLRAAYEGTYILPATTCEMMYNALVSASTASGKTVVTK